MGTWTFGYDALNRITGATNTSAGITGSILSPQTYCYDSFGNRWPGTVSNAACVPGGANTFAPNNQVQPGFAYDLAGNVIANQNFGLGTDTYAWDAENRLQSVNASTFYRYDAEGRRVAKGTVSSSGAFTPTAEYLYGDDATTELDGSGNWKHTDVNAAGRLLATYNPAGLHYQLADWLGTRRVQTSAAGVVEETCVSYPFGDGPTCYGADATEKRFTGKERDTESGLDYFGARYYGSSMGKWSSPDPSGLLLADPLNPQSFNLYSYVGNNPVRFFDPDGLSKDCGGGGDKSVVCLVTSAWDWLSSHVGGGGGGGNGGGGNPPPGWGLTPPSSGHYVTVGSYPAGAGWMGHVGVGLDTPKNTL
jgi:RHS repeat-associated protein